MASAVQAEDLSWLRRAHADGCRCARSMTALTRNSSTIRSQDRRLAVLFFLRSNYCPRPRTIFMKLTVNVLRVGDHDSSEIQSLLTTDERLENINSPAFGCKALLDDIGRWNTFDRCGRLDPTSRWHRVWHCPKRSLHLRSLYAHNHS